jgi:CRP-like cAMP-binding protein
MVVAEAERGTTLFEQGDLGNCFFLIQTGLVEVIVD